MNRLADLLFVLPRVVNARAAIGDESWRKRRPADWNASDPNFPRVLSKESFVMKKIEAIIRHFKLEDVKNGARGTRESTA